ncbi:MAG: HlyD family efflux transporter periplasmic adaptor subunit [Verrucomicrobiota bacterium]
MLFKRLSFYLAIVGLIACFFMVKKLRYRPPPPAPLVEPSRSPYKDSVAATGIIEATKENVKIGASRAGLVQKVLAQIGSEVKTGDALLLFDDREARARFATTETQIKVLEATLAMEKILADDASDQFNRVAKLATEKIASDDELKRKDFSLQASRARVAKVEADIKAAQSQLQQAAVELDILTVRAPRAGVVLQVNVRAGEFATLNGNEPMMILGDVNTLQIRADVDEQNAGLVSPNQPAVAYIKGDTKNPLPLRFVRIEPFVIPKRSLTGDSAERVDTRVLQIIFQLDRPASPLYVGQQVDVFMQRSPKTNETHSSRSR